MLAFPLAGVEGAFQAHLEVEVIVFLGQLVLVGRLHTSQACKDHPVHPLALLGHQDPLALHHMDKV